jgi:hypothetical protein
MSRARVAARAAGAALAWVAAGPLCAAGLCPLEIVGTWRLDDANTRATLLSFNSNGWANLLNGPGEHSPGDIAAQVSYRLEAAPDPRRIDFRARRGNDVFGAGTTSWEITAHSDDSFTARATHSVDGAQSVWTRVQTHRYFLTFAARNATTAGESAAFVMWTTLDGQRTELDALGAVRQGGSARFGKIPFSLARDFAKQGDAARDVMMRIELSEADYRRTRAVHRAWASAAGREPRADPDTQAAQFIEATLESVNRCAPRIRLTDLGALTASAAAPRRPVELVRMIRRDNDRRHVPDKAFPALWKPADLS